MKLGALNPFRFRALLPAVLAVGLLLGVWLGDLFQGFGWGPGQGGGNSQGHAQQKSSADSDDGEADLVGVRATEASAKMLLTTESDDANPNEDRLIHALIDGRNYFVLRGKKKEPIGLTELIDLIKDTRPNEDGGRAIIDRTKDSRPSAEENLKMGLQDAGLTGAVYWTGRAIE